MSRRVYLEDLFRPNFRAEFRQEAARLKMAGLNPLQIAAALRITPIEARKLLLEAEEGAAAAALRDPKLDFAGIAGIKRPGRCKVPTPDDAQDTHDP